MKQNVDDIKAKEARELLEGHGFECCDVECQYVIIDDLGAYNFNEHQLPRLLIVNPFNGLDEETAKRAIELLNSNE